MLEYACFYRSFSPPLIREMNISLVKIVNERASPHNLKHWYIDWYILRNIFLLTTRVTVWEQWETSPIHYSLWKTILLGKCKEWIGFQPYLSISPDQLYFKPSDTTNYNNVKCDPGNNTVYLNFNSILSTPHIPVCVSDMQRICTLSNTLVQYYILSPPILNMQILNLCSRSLIALNW